MRKDNLKKLIKSNKFDYVNENITEENFPDDGQRGNVEIIDFKRTITSEGAIKEMADKGYRPATGYELLSWAKNNWNGKDYIVSLGQIWRSSRGGRGVLCLWGDAGGRGLDLGYFDDGWYRFYRFAFVRQVSSALEPLKPLDFENRLLALESFEKKVREIIKL